MNKYEKIRSDDSESDYELKNLATNENSALSIHRVPIDITNFEFQTTLQRLRQRLFAVGSEPTDILADYWHLITLILPKMTAAKQFDLILTDNFTRPLKIQWSYSVPLTVSVGIGVPANVVYFSTSSSAASKGLPPLFSIFTRKLLFIDSKILTVLNPVTAFFYNGLLNVYFLNYLTMAIWEDACELVSMIARKCRGISIEPSILARRFFQDLDDSACGYFQRGLLKSLQVIVFSAFALLPSSVFYFLDIKSGSPAWESLMVLFSFTALNYNGIAGTAFPLLKEIVARPLRAMHHRRSPAAAKLYQTEQDILRLKAAHIAILGAALHTFVVCCQNKNYEAFEPLFDLSESAEQNPLDAKKLYLRLLKLAQFERPTSATLRTIFQVLGVVINFGSMPGYYFETVSGAAKFFELHGHELSDAGKQFVGMIFSAPSVALGIDVAQSTYGEIYDSGARLLNNSPQPALIATAENQNGQRTPAARSRRIFLPLAVQQHPKLILILLYVLIIFGYFTASTTLALNDDWIGPDGKITQLRNWANFLMPFAIASVWIFNTYPVRGVLYDSQELYVKQWGNAQHKKELKLSLYIRAMIRDLMAATPEQSLKIFTDLLHQPNDLDSVRSERFSEELFKLFFRNAPAEIFGEDHRLVLRADGSTVTDIREVVNQLSNEMAMHKQTKSRPDYPGLRKFSPPRPRPSSDTNFGAAANRSEFSTSFQNDDFEGDDFGVEGSNDFGY